MKIETKFDVGEYVWSIKTDNEECASQCEHCKQWKYWDLKSFIPCRVQIMKIEIVSLLSEPLYIVDDRESIWSVKGIQLFKTKKEAEIYIKEKLNGI